MHFGLTTPRIRCQLEYHHTNAYTTNHATYQLSWSIEHIRLEDPKVQFQEGHKDKIVAIKQT